MYYTDLQTKAHQPKDNICNDFKSVILPDKRFKLESQTHLLLDQRFKQTLVKSSNILETMEDMY